MPKYLLFIILIVLNSCIGHDYVESVGEVPIDIKLTSNYSFFVAGHTYGNPITYQYGLHPPVVEKIPFINKYPEMDLGVLTGDVVPFTTVEYWDAALTDIDKFSKPIHIAAGNHDRGPVFEDLFEYYYSFWNEDDIFIILSPTNWNIEGEQKDFLIETIDNAFSSANNIFIFCHELIWWAPDNEFANVKINYAPQYPGKTNYWSEISPYLESIPKNVVIYAGDLGANNTVTPYMYYKYHNITLIANGVGGGQQDNIIVTEVDEDGGLDFKLLGINQGTPYEIENLKDYKLP